MLLNAQLQTEPPLLNDLIQRYVERPAQQPGGEDSPLAVGSSLTKPGSARRKLWDLNAAAACPVTGVCLPFADVQKLARKAGMNVDAHAEYDVHVMVLHECRRRTRLAESIHRELDTRYALAIQRLGPVKTTEALAQRWDQACMQANWAGDFWAVLTHPRCSAELEYIVLGQVHMLQHQVGMSARVESAQQIRVQTENHRLSQELAAAQQRLQALVSEHAAALEAVQAECMRLRGSVIRAQTERDLAQTQWRELKHLEPNLLAHQRLREENERQRKHNEKLLARALQREVERPPATSMVITPATPGQTVSAAGGVPRAASPANSQTVIELKERLVLCVGGRTTGIPVYRAVIEDRGARFMHHDGGEEDNASRLGNQLQAADVVICQVGCISHGAYWRVKDHCKRTGKPCLFVETPSRSALERALGEAVAAASMG